LSQAERLRKQIAQLQIPIQDSTISISASFGVTTALPGQSWTPEELIHKADEALYLAKRRGRNRVEFLSHDAQPAAAATPEPEIVAR
jgi:diguanylate cyclase (GGDEF)-like protein